MYPWFGTGVDVVFVVVLDVVLKPKSPLTFFIRSSSSFTGSQLRSCLRVVDCTVGDVGGHVFGADKIGLLTEVP